MSSLNQIGKALESYCGDYGGYFPAKPAYGQAPSYSSAVSPSWPDSRYYADRGLLADNTCPVYTDQPGFGMVDDYLQTIAFGHPDSTANNVVVGNTSQFRGKLQAGPRNIGYLAFTGYMDDTRVFYCPSASLTPRDVVRSWVNPSNSNLEGPAPGVVYSLQQLALLGGFTAKDLFNGNYSVMGRESANGAGYPYRSGQYYGNWGESGDPVTNATMGAWSSYSYRLAPIWGGGEGPYHANAYPAFYTAPKVMTQNGCPLFKTQKLAGNYAVLADMVTRPTVSINANRPGFGVWAHAEGYNVLYADWHGAWYGDSEQRVMWHSMGRDLNGNLVASGYWSAYTGLHRNLMHPSYVPAWQEVFHYFDQAAGVGATTP